MTDTWGRRLNELITEYGVPGATLAYSHRGERHEFAAGVLHRGTGVEATPDSLFQIGSVTKIWTTTQIMLLAERGLLTIDTPVRELLPEFRVADPHVTRSVTVRHLLTHTSGIDGDLFLDTGRGDDTLEKYVAACAELTQLHPMGATQSYVNAAFPILGRIVERLTGQVWDAALRTQIIEPLGLRHTVTLPEEALLYRTAVGHLGKETAPTPKWGLMRPIGPAGLICASAADVVTFGLAHLGTELLSARSAAEMRRPQVELPNRHSLGSHWGLGWILDWWDGLPILWHSGSTIGQQSALWVVPDRDLVIALCTNGGHDGALRQRLIEEMAGELVRLTPRPTLRPPDSPVYVDVERYAGVYDRRHVRTEITTKGTGLHARVEVTTPGLTELSPPLELDLIPVDETTFVGRAEGDPSWIPFVFYDLPDGTSYVHYSARANPRVA
ncbi:serine hydrolase domain-containing protein [Actinocorallia longicatena]|uniref:Beta-lactamase-related domain-containing protein n=1 Tax=Actinocorallia longicatena TaxID=111803 RepID=A0ABP6QQ27_9ACTN